MTVLIHFALRVVPFSNTITTHSWGSFTVLPSAVIAGLAHLLGTVLKMDGLTHFAFTDQKRFVKYTFYFYFALLRKDKLLKHQHGMLAAQCHENTNKKTSTYQCLQNQPSLGILFISYLKLGFKMSSCGKEFKRRTARKYEVSTLRTRSHDSYYFASLPTDRACNLRRC